MEVLEWLLKLFTGEMLGKMVARQVKYSGPGESVADDSFDWSSYPLHAIVAHFKREIVERFPTLPYGYDGELAASSAEANMSEEEKMQEDIDLANMAFLDWAMRRARRNSGPGFTAKEGAAD
jgi:hypothetical protein